MLEIGIQSKRAVELLKTGISAVQLTKSTSRYDQNLLRLLDEGALHSMNQGHRSAGLKLDMTGILKTEHIPRKLKQGMLEAAACAQKRHLMFPGLADRHKRAFGIVIGTGR